jgi:hypothetical protein
MIPALFLVLAAVVARVAAGLLIHSGTNWLSNFTPFAALALCCAAFLPARLKFTVPLLALFVTDLIINAWYGAALLNGIIIARYAALAVVGLLGLLLQHRRSLGRMLGGSLVASTLFYVITNAFSWLSDPGYAKNVAGLVQSLTVGLPEYSATPTWMFFRNSLVSDLIFTAAFVACFAFSRSAERARAAIPSPA